MKPPSNDASRANAGSKDTGAEDAGGKVPGSKVPGSKVPDGADGAAATGGTQEPVTPPVPNRSGTPPSVQVRPPEPAKSDLSKPDQSKPDASRNAPNKAEPATPSAGVAPSSAGQAPISTDPKIGPGLGIETGRPAPSSSALPDPVKSKPGSALAPGSAAGAASPPSKPATEATKPVTEPVKPAPDPVQPARPDSAPGTAAPIAAVSGKSEQGKSEQGKSEVQKSAAGSATEPPRAGTGPSPAGTRPGGAVTDGPIIDLKARRVEADAKGDVRGDAMAGAAGAAATMATSKSTAAAEPIGGPNGAESTNVKPTSTTTASTKPAGAGGAPPRVGPSEATAARGPGFGTIAASGLLGGVIGVGLLFAVEHAGILGTGGDEARLNALDQRVSGQFTGLDQRMAGLSPRDAVAALDRRVAASEAALKPLPEAVKAAEAQARQALDRVNGAPAAAQPAPAEGQAASPAAAVPADLAARLDSLDQRLSALQEEPGREQPADPRLGVTQAGDGGRRLTALDERVKALEGKAPDKAVSARPQPVDLAPKLASLQGEVEARTKAGAEADQALGQRLDALQKTLDDRVKAATEAVQTATQASRDVAEAGRTQSQEAAKTLDRRMQEQSDKIASLDKVLASRAEASTVLAALKVVTADRIASALEAGVPYAEPLATLRKLETGDASRIDALGPFAETGAPTVDRLAATFRPIAETIAIARKTAAGKDVAANGDLKSRFLSIADSIVQVRKVDAPAAIDAADTDPAARVQAALDRGALREAAQAYEALPADAKAQAGDFGASLKARAAAAQAAQALLSDAFKGLPVASPAATR